MVGMWQVSFEQRRVQSRLSLYAVVGLFTCVSGTLYTRSQASLHAVVGLFTDRKVTSNGSSASLMSRTEAGSWSQFTSITCMYAVRPHIYQYQRESNIYQQQREYILHLEHLYLVCLPTHILVSARICNSSSANIQPVSLLIYSSMRANIYSSSNAYGSWSHLPSITFIQHADARYIPVRGRTCVSSMVSVPFFFIIICFASPGLRRCGSWRRCSG